MGLGDEIMALGEAETAFEIDGVPVAIIDVYGNPRKHPAWEGSIAWNKKSHKTVVNCPKSRGYIKRWDGSKIVFNMDYRPMAGRITLTHEIVNWSESIIPLDPFIVAAPNVKDTASPNKVWPFEYWQELVKKIDMPIVQLVQDGERILDGVIAIKTPTFRHAAAVIQCAEYVICHEGGTHHMAASVGAEAIVLFGSFIPPEVTGYEYHANITTQDAHYCGEFTACPHCKSEMLKIAPDMVHSILERGLNGQEIKGIHRL
jgi:hypothetical protein